MLVRFRDAAAVRARVEGAETAVDRWGPAEVDVAEAASTPEPARSAAEATAIVSARGTAWVRTRIEKAPTRGERPGAGSGGPAGLTVGRIAGPTQLGEEHEP